MNETQVFPIDGNLICPMCGIFLSEPYIRCAECTDPPRCICLYCFSKGREYENHKKNHSYYVIKDDFTLFDSDWLASEEVKLLQGIEEKGFGNWEDIARTVGTKTKVECEDHYFKYYLSNASSFQNLEDTSIPLLPALPAYDDTTDEVNAEPPSIQFQDPTRPSGDSVLSQEMGGYMNARGDFVIEYDNYAELDAVDFTFNKSDDPDYNDLQFEVMKIYQSRLKERCERKKFISDYGAISEEKMCEDLKRYAVLGENIYDILQKCMRFYKPIDFYKMVEGFLAEKALKDRILVLQDCLRKGVTELDDVETYLELKQKYEDDQIQHKKTLLDEMLVLLKNDPYFNNVIHLSGTSSRSDREEGIRRSAIPLNIASLPLFEQLNSKERALCSSLRFTPENFLQYKSSLLAEYKKLGSLKLANARSMIKIDVNKTRKLYNFLIEEGLITQGT